MEQQHKEDFNLITIRKDLMKNKQKAEFSHYCAGNLYYNIKLEDATYQFPVSTIENCSIRQDLTTELVIEEEQAEVSSLYSMSEIEHSPDSTFNVDRENSENSLKVTMIAPTIKLSSDLGTTPFENEIEGTYLFRWMRIAIENGNFIRISSKKVSEILTK